MEQSKDHTDPASRKGDLSDRLKRLQEKTGDLAETLERIDNRLSEAAGDLANRIHTSEE